MACPRFHNHQWQSQESEFCSFWLQSLEKRAAEHGRDEKKERKEKKATGIKQTKSPAKNKNSIPIRQLSGPG